MVWLGVLAGLTLSRQDPSRMDPSLPQLSFCLVCGERGTSDALLNVLLFTPLGFFLQGRRWSVLRVAVVGLLLSSSVEVAQHFIPGRYSNLGDVAWNTAGAALGAWVWSIRSAWLPPAPTRGRAIGTVATLLAVGVPFAFGWLTEPDRPEGRYGVQWTPDLSWMDRYAGRVAGARLDAVQLPAGPFASGGETQALLRGDWTLEVRAEKGAPPRSLAPILSLRSGHGAEVLMLGATGEDLVYRERSRAQALRLDGPDLRLPGALAAVGVGEALTLEIRRRGKETCMAVDGRARCPGYTPGRAWSLLMYRVDAGERTRLRLDLLWMFVLLVPVGFWAAGARAALIRGLVVGAGTLAAVGATRLVLPGWGEVAAGVVGLAVGHSLRRVLRSLLRGGRRAPVAGATGTG